MVTAASRASQAGDLWTSITGSGGTAIEATKVVTRRVTVPGNGDVVSTLPPQVKNTICGTGLRSDDTGSWGVCLDD